ncbi:glutathione S-transferase T3-like [Zingiber officinale]|uniref:glutathione S-transferase T3-like n=1 Tax=Zingiber officinale TaxID=94328 RepID=UPI001C4D8130|nr:glutathione S-transferase T3-like [Zingiber officinale]
MPFTSPTENEPFNPTFVPKTQLSDRESTIELVNLEKVDSDTAGRRKRSTWSKVEDEVLARSFVTISDDPIIDNDQKVDAFWGRIASCYNENRPPGTPNRIASVIRSHWHNTIQKKVYRFNANYNSIYSVYRSGHSDEDILRLAYEKYREENNGIAFNLEHVWRIIKDRPSFTPQSVDHLVGTKKARTSESAASNTSSNQDASLHVDLNKEETCPMGQHVDLNEEETHPMGQKAAKRKGKGKMKSDIEGMTTNLDNMFAKFTEYTSIKMAEVEMKKQLKVEEMKANATEMKAKAALAKVQLKEYAILSKDTSQMTEEQLIIHEHLCQEIKGRWNM